MCFKVIIALMMTLKRLFQIKNYISPTQAAPSNNAPMIFYIIRSALKLYFAQ